MNILGVDSSGTVASVAVLSGDTLLAEFTVNNKLTHSQTLLPMLDEAVRYSGLSLDEIDAIAVSAGPGSFTGLRIGASTVKGLGLVLDKPVIPVPTLEGLAYQMAHADGLVCPIMDARRSQVYTGIYSFGTEGFTVVMDQCALDIHDLTEILKKKGEAVHFLGDGVPVYRDVIVEMLASVLPLDFALPHYSRQSAAAVAVLGMKYYQEGRMESASEHKPVYLRKSQAERERERKMKEGQDNLKICKMKKADIPDMAALAGECCLHGWSAGEYEKTADDENMIYLSCFMGDELVGGCAVLCSYETADLCNIMVAEGLRRRGIARKMLEKAAELCRKRGVQKILLEVRESNAAAIALYRKSTFEQIAIRHGYYHEPVEDALVMQAVL